MPLRTWLSYDAPLGLVGVFWGVLLGVFVGGFCWRFLLNVPWGMYRGLCTVGDVPCP